MVGPFRFCNIKTRLLLNFTVGKMFTYIALDEVWNFISNKISNSLNRSVRLWNYRISYDVFKRLNKRIDFFAEVNNTLFTGNMFGSNLYTDATAILAYRFFF